MAFQNGAMGAKRGIWLIDGYNVLHTVLLGGQTRSGDKAWGRANRDRLIERIRGFETLGLGSASSSPNAAAMQGPGIAFVVFDGNQPASEADQEAPLRIIFAPSADDWIVRQVRHASQPGDLVVVSADRQLTERCRHAGARVVSPRDFMARCPAPDP